MNYIKKLEWQNADFREALQKFDRESAQFMAHLAGPKFTGTEANGGRKDWIAVADVINRFREMRTEVFAKVNP